jgi:hypothetical protein
VLVVQRRRACWSKRKDVVVGFVARECGSGSEHSELSLTLHRRHLHEGEARLGEKGCASALQVQERPLRVPELEDAGVLDGEEWDPARFRVALPLDADQVSVLGLASLADWGKSDGIVIVIGRLEGDSQDCRDWVRPPVSFCDLGEALDRLLE